MQHERGRTTPIGYWWEIQKRPLGRSRSRCDNIKMDLGEIRCCGVEWIGLAYDRDQWRALVNAVMNFRVP
jgi:hypothetical protein